MKRVVAVLKDDVLKQHIVRSMLSQKEFAQSIPVSESYLSQLLSGQRYPSPDIQRCLLKATDKKFDDLFETRLVIRQASSHLPKRRVPSDKTLLRMAKARIAAKKRSGYRRNMD